MALGDDQPTFRAFDERGGLRIYHRNLPHWRQPGATYFVTFRQADSIPRAVLSSWNRMREEWLTAHGIQQAWETSQPGRYLDLYQNIPSEDRRQFERKVSKLLHHELDLCHGSCRLRDPACSRLVFDALTHFHAVRMRVGDFVIMPNHVHAILQPISGHELEDILESVKKFTSRRLSTTGVGQSFREAESYDRIIRDLDELASYRRYIVQNPVKARLHPGEFLLHGCHWLD